MQRARKAGLFFFSFAIVLHTMTLGLCVPLVNFVVFKISINTVCCIISLDYTHSHACKHTHVHMHTHTHIYTRVHTYTHVYTNTCTQMHTYTSHAHTHTRAHTHICVHTHTHTHTHTFMLQFCLHQSCFPFCVCKNDSVGAHSKVLQRCQ